MMAMVDNLYPKECDLSDCESCSTTCSKSDRKKCRYGFDTVYSKMAAIAKTKGIREPPLPAEKAKRKLSLVSPLLWVQLNSDYQWHHALVDTGAAINMISKDLLQHFRHYKLGKASVHLKGVTGDKVDLDEWYVVYVRFQCGKEIGIPCLAGCPEGIDMILGMPWIKQVRAVIDARNQMLMTDFGDLAWGDLSRERVVKLPVGCVIPEGDLTAEQVAELDKAMESCTLSPKAAEKIRQKLIQCKSIWTQAGCGQAK